MDTYIQKLRYDLNENLDVTVDVSYEESYEFVDWENLGVLFGMNILSTQKVRRRKITVSSESNEIGKIEWAVCFDDGISYIHWTQVKEKYQRQGIGSTVRSTVVRSLQESPSINRIYTEGYSEAGRSMIEHQDFTQTDTLTDDYRDWYVQKV